MDNIKGAIFDLDGVIVDTAKYHYLAWARLAKELGFEFTLQDNERLKGVSRVRSLEILLEIGDKNLSEAEKSILAEKKNNWYVDYIKKMDESELLRGAKEYIIKLKSQGVKIALGSASKNASMILENLKIVELFDAVIDGNRVSKAKPDPEVFILGALELGLEPTDCVVFEDAAAGVEAAKRTGMKVVGIGEKEILKAADLVIAGLYELL
ncbi:MAG: beta-phosphoglucomutase [Ruminiclostridium sp.]